MVNCHHGWRRGEVVVVIVPHEHRDRSLLTAGERRDVGALADADVPHRLERDGTGNFHRDAIAAHLPEHPEAVQHRIGKAVGRKVAEAVEIRLILELECPCHRAEQVHLVQVRELIGAGDLLSGVTRIHRAVAIRVVRIGPDRARRATLRIGLADDNRDVLELGIGGDDRKSIRDGAELDPDGHPDPGGVVFFDDPRRALRMKRDVVERRPDPSGRVVGAAKTMLDEVAQELLRARPLGPVTSGPPMRAVGNARLRPSAA